MYFCLFDTPLGQCAIAWGDRGLLGVHLPEKTAAATRRAMRERFSGTKELQPPVAIRRVIRQLQAMLMGQRVDLREVPLDLSAVPDFHRRVYELVMTIPSGHTLSYGEVARRLRKPGAARAVGQAMARNPWPLIVPCHRVLAAQGKLGGFTSSGGTDTKAWLLAREGVSTTKAQSPRRKPPAATAFPVRAALRHLRRVDPVMADLIKSVGRFALTIEDDADVFQALARAIVYQQLHGKAAATILRRVGELFANGAGFTAQDIDCCSDDRLRGAGLSRNKLLALRDLSARVLAGEIPTLTKLHSLDNPTIIERLTRVRGIGQWTVEMLLIFRLARADVLPASDFGVRKGFMVTYGLDAMPTPAQLLAHGERWAPYRSVASWYLWRAADQAAVRA